MNDNDQSHNKMDSMLDEGTVEANFVKISDLFYTIPLFVIMLVVVFISKCIINYSWF